MQTVIRESENHYKEDFDYNIQVTRWLLKPAGAWPELPTGLTITNIMKNIIRLCYYILVVIVVVPGTLYTIFDVKDFSLKLDAIGPTSSIFIGGMIYTALLYHGSRIRESIKDIENDWRNLKGEHNRKLMLKNIRISRVVVSISALILQGSIVFYDVGRALTSIDVVVNNETITTRLLPCPVSKMIIDTRVSPVYEIVLVLQCISTVLVINVLVGGCALAAVLAMHAYSQLDIIISRFQELTDKQESVVQSELANIVRHHIRILRFITRMDIILREICFLEVFQCTLGFCVPGYNMLSHWREINIGSLIAFILFLLSMTYTIFIFCYIGDLVMEQCKKVSEAAYMVKWYYLPSRTAVSLIFIILRASVPVKITGGKIFPMSIITFGTVMKASIVYLNILRTLNT